MSQPIVLITGITGQDGSYLAELLLEKGYVVHGVVRLRSQLGNIAHLHGQPGLPGALFLHEADVTDRVALREIIREVRPSEIYHLAGQSHIGRSFEAPELTYEQTGKAAAQLLEIAREELPQTKFFHASSAEIFGSTATSPQTETTPLQPTNPYGRAKAFATEEARRYRESYGLFVCNGILYNHESPRRGANFVTQKIARAAARIARGIESELILGRLDSRRDWGRAQDYVRAMWLMLQQQTADDYIVATGETHSVQEFTEAAFGVVELPWKKFVRHDPALNRPGDPQLVGCADKIRNRLGWRPTGGFEQLVREMVQAELNRIDRGAA
jgi:GDPmannose 4,6-dehydratase